MTHSCPLVCLLACASLLVGCGGGDESDTASAASADNLPSTEQLSSATLVAARDFSFDLGRMISLST